MRYTEAIPKCGQTAEGFDARIGADPGRLALGILESMHKAVGYG